MQLFQRDPTADIIEVARGVDINDARSCGRRNRGRNISRKRQSVCANVNFSDQARGAVDRDSVAAGLGIATLIDYAVVGCVGGYRDRSSPDNIRFVGHHKTAFE